MDSPRELAAMPMTPREIAAAFRVGHVQDGPYPDRCAGCYGSWPCLHERAAAELERGADAIEALEKIAGLNPDDSAEGLNEWGEAEMFRKAQEIADEVLEDSQVAAHRDDTLRHAPRSREVERGQGAE